jgi:hypothetical protein
MCLAVLPMANDTNDLDGPTFVRQLIFQGLAQRGYTLMPMAEIDAKLKVQGFTDGGQLKAATPQKIGEWIGCDGLFYSTLEEFNYITVAFYSKRTVKIDAQLMNGQTGEKFWEADRSFSTQAVATNKRQAEEEFAIQMAIKAAEKMAHTPLKPETQRTVFELLNTLPR